MVDWERPRAGQLPKQSKKIEIFYNTKKLINKLELKVLAAVSYWIMNFVIRRAEIRRRFILHLVLCWWDFQILRKSSTKAKHVVCVILDAPKYILPLRKENPVSSITCSARRFFIFSTIFEVDCARRRCEEHNKKTKIKINKERKNNHWPGTCGSRLTEAPSFKVSMIFANVKLNYDFKILNNVFNLCHYLTNARAHQEEGGEFSHRREYYT